MYVLSDKELFVQEQVREFVTERIEPHANMRNNNCVYPDDLINDLAALGYFGMMIPEEYGGCGFSAVTAITVIYEIAKSDPAIAHMIEHVNFGFCYPVFLFGSEWAKEKYLKPVASGKDIGVLAFHESEKEVSTFAESTKEGFALSGTKSMITDAPNGKYAIVYAKTDKSAQGYEGYSTFILDIQNSPGVLIGELEQTCGMRSLQVADIHLDNVSVNSKNLLHKSGKGIEVISKAMEVMRIANAAVACGIAERAYEEAVEYAKNRLINGKPMFEMQVTQHELAELRANLEVIKLATFYTAELFDKRKKEIMLYSSITKLQVAENAKNICDRALQIFGGYGYIQGYTVERLYRDVRLLSIIGGINEMLKWSIARFV